MTKSGDTVPGVYVEEVPPGRPPISGVATSKAAIVGRSAAGSAGVPHEVRSVAEYTATFGGAVPSVMDQAVRSFFANGGTCAVILFAPESSGDPESNFDLQLLDGTEFNLLVLPDLATFEPEAGASRIAAAGSYCASRRGFLIADCPRQLGTGATLPAWAAGLAKGLGQAASHVALYAPEPCFTGPDGQPLRGPVAGAVAGVYARTDLQRGVWKAPAGVDARLVDAVGIAGLTDRQMRPLADAGICAIKALPSGIVVWGARTLAGAATSSSDWKYVPVRRLACFIEESIEKGLQWVLFEPNGEGVWAAVRLIVGSFLNGLFRQRAFQGWHPRDAFFVRCDRTTMTQADIDSGRLVVEIGFAPLKPAEFVVLRIGLWTADADPDDV